MTYYVQVNDIFPVLRAWSLLRTFFLRSVEFHHALLLSVSASKQCETNVEKRALGKEEDYI